MISQRIDGKWNVWKRIGGYLAPNPLYEDYSSHWIIIAVCETKAEAKKLC